MIITKEQAKAVRRKQADCEMTKKETAKEIGISYPTFMRIVKGDYDAKKSIYAKTMEWLAKDY